VYDICRTSSISIFARKQDVDPFATTIEALFHGRTCTSNGGPELGPSNNVPVDGHDLRAALDAVLAAEQKPGIGCSIKWRAGNELEYF